MGTPTTLPELRAAFLAGHHQAVLAALGELDVLEACCRASVAGLIAELAYLVREAPVPIPVEVHVDHASGARLNAEVLAIFAAILEENRAVLAKSPEWLFSILFHELSWREPGLSRLAEHFRVTFEARPGACWLRPLLPPETPTLVSWRIRGEPRSLSADGRMLLLALGGPGHPTGGASRCLLDPVTGEVLLTVAKTSGSSLSPDGACLALFTGKNAELWSTKTRATYATLGAHDRDVQRAVFSRDSRVVFTEASKVVRALRVADGACLASRTIDTESSFGGLLPAGEGAVLIHDGRRWLLWEYLEDRLHPIGDADSVTAEWSAVSPSGDRLIAAEGGGAWSCWSLPHGRLLFRTKRPEQAAALAFHPSGGLFTGGQGFYDATTGAELARLPSILVSAGRSPAFDPTGRFLVTRHEVPEAAQLWDVRDLAAPVVIARFSVGRHTRGEPRAHFSADGRALVFGDWNETVVVDLRALPERSARDDVPPVRTAWPTRFSPARTSVVFGHDRALSFWDVRRGVLRRLVPVDRALSYFAAGSRVLARTGEVLSALDVESGEEVWRITQPGDSSEEAHPADDQGVLLYNERKSDGVVLGLDMGDGRVRYRLSGQTLLLHALEVFLTWRGSNAEGEGALRDVTTGEVRLSLPGLRRGLCAISPDHRWLAVHQLTTELWDLTTGLRAHELDSTAYSFRFREDSLALIATSTQSAQSGNTDTVSEEVFDVTTGKRIGGSSWDEYGTGEDSPPVEIAPGIVQDGGTLRVGERALPLPASAAVCRTPGGQLFVAGLSTGNRVELYRGESGDGHPRISAPAFTGDATTKRGLVRALVARCPDAATESVLADWCEENERLELVPWLRSQSADVRAGAVGHLVSTLESDLTPETLDSAHRHDLERPLGQLPTRRCSTCGRTALVVVEDKRRSSADDDYDQWQETWALCLHGLHRERLD